ncbi:WD40/YVTN/BNR-like repeat-containing protein [Sedimenticola hydrogenitrophicus]|uniref:WD40/YVTN/BNR-like repeat-containing protein n=1 Tax=Sedimenticola hydrogenitrophicus TaxID=2967975 RepID=UPI0023AF4F9C|nr:exo-alpha-sialidase [Sedimenticola hydrogenitrophicus]
MAIMLALVLVPGVGSAESVPLSQLRQSTHFHGISVDPQTPGHLYLATHHGFYHVAPEGSATRLSEDRNDYMGFTPHPRDVEILYATGHPARGGNMGFIRSNDGGKTWRQLSKGVGGPVDFHQMDVSRADPNQVYGVYRGNLQHSVDGGDSWNIVARSPEGLVDIAASALDINRLYAATQQGLLRSDDGGRSWRNAHLFRQPATLVYTGPGGSIYAFMVGRGLLRADESKPGWRPLGPKWGDRYLLHLAEDPNNSEHLYAIASDGEILVSQDASIAWAPFGTP